jgi:hypothetical protein
VEGLPEQQPDGRMMPTKSIGEATVQTICCTSISIGIPSPVL